MASASSIRFVLNDVDLEVSLGESAGGGEAGGLSVLDFVRRQRRLTGTKEGCKEGDCGACTVLVGDLGADRVRYQPVTSCLMPLAEAAGKHLVTIEGLDVGRANSVQRRIVEAGASQCGFCTPGIAVSLVGRLMDGAAPAADDDTLPAEVDRALSGHLCRCTGYRSLRDATSLAYRDLAAVQGVEALVDAGELPPYFLEIPERLSALRGPALAPVHRVDAPVVAGGTDLYVQRSEELPTRQVTALNTWLPARPELRGVQLDENGSVRIGALTTFEDLAESETMGRLMPSVGDFMHLIASWQIRNRSTVGGNLVNASPIGDVTILMLALGAEVVLESAEGERRMPLCDFYRGYKQLDLKRGEILTSVLVPGRYPLGPRASRPLPSEGTDFIDFEKVSKRRTLDIATVNTAVRLRIVEGIVEDAGLAAGGVAPIPLFLTETSKSITGRPLDRETLALAVATAQQEISPISDVRGSADYKRLLVRNLLAAHLAKAAEIAIDTVFTSRVA